MYLFRHKVVDVFISSLFLYRLLAHLEWSLHLVSLLQYFIQKCISQIYTYIIVKTK